METCIWGYCTWFWNQTQNFFWLHCHCWKIEHFLMTWPLISIIYDKIGQLDSWQRLVLADYPTIQHKVMFIVYTHSKLCNINNANNINWFFFFCHCKYICMSKHNLVISYIMFLDSTITTKIKLRRNKFLIL